MKKAFAVASLVCVALVALPAAQIRRAGPPGPAVTPRATQDVAVQREWLDKYCVSCHSQKTALPANDPVKLDTARRPKPTGL